MRIAVTCYCQAFVSCLSVSLYSCVAAIGPTRSVSVITHLVHPVYTEGLLL